MHDSTAPKVTIENYEDGPTTSEVILFRSMYAARNEFEKQVLRTKSDDEEGPRTNVLLSKEYDDGEDAIGFEKLDEFSGEKSHDLQEEGAYDAAFRRSMNRNR